MTKEIAVRTDGQLATLTTVGEVKLALRDATLDEIKDLRDRASAAEVYARARQSRETYLVAGEIRLWAERRAGEIRRALPRRHGPEPRFDRAEAKRLREQGLSRREVGKRLGVDKAAIGYAERAGWGDGVKGIPLKEFDDQLGASPAIAYTWEKLAEIPEETFVALVDQAKEADAALTAAGILRRDARSYETRVEPGIYRLRDGRLSLRWRKDGVPRMKVLDHGDITRARETLAIARGKIKPPRVRNGTTVGDSYALVRRSLQTLDNLDAAEFDPEAKRAINRAIAALHEAEDALVIASNRIIRRT